MLESKASPVESGEQAAIIDSNLQVGFASSAVSQAESKRNLADRGDACAYQNIKEQLESGFLKGDAVEAFTTNKEVSRHGIFGAKPCTLNWPGNPYSRGRKKLAGWVPFS